MTTVWKMRFSMLLAAMIALAVITPVVAEDALQQSAEEHYFAIQELHDSGREAEANAYFSGLPQSTQDEIVRGLR